jgi:hypothetical protein
LVKKNINIAEKNIIFKSVQKKVDISLQLKNILNNKKFELAVTDSFVKELQKELKAKKPAQKHEELNASLEYIKDFKKVELKKKIKDVEGLTLDQNTIVKFIAEKSVKNIIVITGDRVFKKYMDLFHLDVPTMGMFNNYINFNNYNEFVKDVSKDRKKENIKILEKLSPFEEEMLKEINNKKKINQENNINEENNNEQKNEKEEENNEEENEKEKEEEGEEEEEKEEEEKENEEDKNSENEEINKKDKEEIDESEEEKKEEKEEKTNKRKRFDGKEILEIKKKKLKESIEHEEKKSKEIKYQLKKEKNNFLKRLTGIRKNDNSFEKKLKLIRHINNIEKTKSKENKNSF